MNQPPLQELLEAVAAGRVAVQEALTRLSRSPNSDLAFATIDHDRAARCGVPEVVFAERKPPDQVCAILERLLERHGHALATRLTAEGLAAIRTRWPAAECDELARTALLGRLPAPPPGEPPVLVIAAGTSDLGVAREAATSARYAGCAVESLTDVGVAGLHRLLAHHERLAEAGCVIVVAGMEGALPSVVGGLVSVPVIAVPTSVGYGAAFAGLAPLLGMLNSCAAGVAVVNIDNGFGAGACAARILLTARRQSQP